MNEVIAKSVQKSQITMTNSISGMEDDAIRSWRSGEALSPSNTAKKPVNYRPRNSSVNPRNDQDKGNMKQEKKTNDPWWMRSDEENNPFMLPRYRPWWMVNFYVDNSWTLPKLKAEAARRALDSKGKKDELIASINLVAKLYDLSDDNFTEPEFIETDSSRLPSCYPEVYSKTPVNK